MDVRPAPARPLRVIPRLIAAVAILGTLAFMSAGSAAPAAASGDPVIAAAGDIACDPASSLFHDGNGTTGQCKQLATSNLLVDKGLAAVLALGDTQYNCGSLTAFNESYAVSWGRVKSITHPVVGNHEYLTSGGSGTTGCTSSNAGAAGYFSYFGAAAGTKGQGWYSFDIGAWHIIALNSSCSSVGGCSTTSAQGKWLAADLAAHPNRCVLAYWHIPLFSSGGRARSVTQPFWDLLYGAHADLVLDGHDHIYERFSPQTPDGVATSNGIREITVGTGGANHTGIVSIAANSLVRNTTSYGVLYLTLHATTYDWKFVPANGSFTDSGSAACRA